MLFLLLMFFIGSPISVTYAHNKFLILMGPSGAGKSSLIRYLRDLDARFTYVTPLITRELRQGEQDKIKVTVDKIEQLEKEGRLLTVNVIYGIHYATPKYIIDDALKAGLFPILDWPVDKLEIMEKNYGDRLFKVYVQPDDIQELKRRLSLDGRDITGQRYQMGIEELARLEAGKYNGFFDLQIINKKDHEKEIAQYIYDHFLAS